MADDEAPIPEEPLAQWAEVQKRTFTRWLNVHLVNRGVKVNDLSQDLNDGLVLIYVLEEISGKKIPKYHKAVKMRIHKTENVAAAMDFMRSQGLKFTNIGASDIVDKKTKLILGVVWTIILRYQIQKIEHSGDSGKSVNAELLDWIHKAIPEYKIRNFSTDWKDGKAICALVNYLKSDVIDLTLLNKREPKENAANAINEAEVNFQIPPILEAEDMVIEEPDDLSIMTYLSYFRDYDRKHRDCDAGNSYADGPGLQGGVIGDENLFNVYPKNSFGHASRIPDGALEVKVHGPHGEAKDVTVDLHKNNDGSVVVNYNLPENTEEGTYKIDVKINGAPVKNSPYHVDFYKVDPETLKFAKQTTVDLSGLDKETTPDGDKVFTVSPNGTLPAGSHYQVNIKGPDGSVIPATVGKPKDDGNYDVKFYPTKDGKHEIAVNLLDPNNKAARAKGSPFHPHVSQHEYNYPRVIFPTYPNLGQHAVIVDSDKQPHSVKHVLSNLPAGWKYHIEIKLKDPSGALHTIEGSPFELETPDHE